MALENIIYNFRIHRLLRKFAKQRITVVHKEQNVWLIEYAVKHTDENSNLLRTCYMRGWIEPMQESVGFGEVNDDGTLVGDQLYNRIDTMWKLTDSGWGAINRNHQLMVLGVFLTIISIVISIK